MQEPKIEIKGYRVAVLLDTILQAGSTVELADMSEQFEKQRGTVAKIGDGRYNHAGDIAKFDVKVGDHVMMSQYATFRYVEDGKTYVIVAGEDIIGIVP